MSVEFCRDCVDAGKKFRRGDKVILTVYGCTQLSGLIMKHATGVVTGFGRSWNLVRVLTAGKKRPESYHSGYWDRL